MGPRMDEHTGTLETAACWELLGRNVIGRIAVILDDHPEIFPINYVLDADTVVFRTAAGTKLLNALKGPCALEVDGYGSPSGMAWSVVVKGQAGVMEDPTEKLRADALKLDPWQPGSKHHYLRIRPTSVTGRQFKTTLPDVWNTPPWDARTELFH